jgi:hypothetical protein
MSNDSGGVPADSAESTVSIIPYPGELDPFTVVSVLPPALVSQLDNLIVFIYDGESSVTYRMPIFLGKVYPISNGLVRFGSRRLQLTALRIFVGSEVNFLYPDMKFVASPY